MHEGLIALYGNEGLQEVFSALAVLPALSHLRTHLERPPLRSLLAHPSQHLIISFVFLASDLDDLRLVIAGVLLACVCFLLALHAAQSSWVKTCVFAKPCI